MLARGKGLKNEWLLANAVAKVLPPILLISGILPAF
jgi:hypothetical protein